VRWRPAAEEGKIFFVSRMQDRIGAASIPVTDLLERPIIAGKIQAIPTSTPASLTKLQADEHWLGQHFEPIEAAPANEMPPSGCSTAL
jgi:hypothetical protein